MASKRWGGESERELIAAIQERASLQRGARGRSLAVGIGDDCAVLRPSPGEDLVVTTDLLLEGVHFRRDWHPPESAGHRCLARGLSDLAAMGGRPVAALLSLAIPQDLRGAWLERFFTGWMRLAERCGVPLAGGDTAESPRGPALSRVRSAHSGLFVADIVLIGSVPQRKSLLRSGAKSGDILYVTGKLGGAAVELSALEQTPAAFAKKTRATPSHPHLYPAPRLAAGRELLERRLASAAMDLSDGLSIDLARLCESSQVSAIVEADLLPRARGATLEQALHGGEDYELLFTARASVVIPARVAGVPVRAIGRIMRRTSQASVTLVTADGTRSALAPGGWEHFRS